MADLKVVELRPEGYSDPIRALRSVLEMMESGEIEPCETGALVLMGKSGSIETYGFGPKSDDLQVLGLLRLGEQIVIDGSFPKGG